MGYYVVMVSEQEFTRLQETQAAIDRMPDVPERPEAAYHDAWASCLACGDRCEYGEASNSRTQLPPTRTGSSTRTVPGNSCLNQPGSQRFAH